jgi:hypothetical protein
MTIKILPTWQGKNNETGDDHSKLMEPADSSKIQITVGPKYGSHNLDSRQIREWHVQENVYFIWPILNQESITPF